MDEITITDWLYAAVFAVMCWLGMSGCTGPFGMVVGGERVHELYNARHNTGYRYGFADYGEPMDYHAPSDKRALQAEISKRLGEDVRRNY